jgi:hypothetical protein
MPPMVLVDPLILNDPQSDPQVTVGNATIQGIPLRTYLVQCFRFPAKTDSGSQLPLSK